MSEREAKGRRYKRRNVVAGSSAEIIFPSGEAVSAPGDEGVADVRSALDGVSNGVSNGESVFDGEGLAPEAGRGRGVGGVANGGDGGRRVNVGDGRERMARELEGVDRGRARGVAQGSQSRRRRAREEGSKLLGKGERSASRKRRLGVERSRRRGQERKRAVRGRKEEEAASRTPLLKELGRIGARKTRKTDAPVEKRRRRRRRIRRKESRGRNRNMRIHNGRGRHNGRTRASFERKTNI